MDHYPIPPHLQEAYKHIGYQKGDFPIAEEIAETCLSLPVWPGMRAEQMLRITELIRNFYKL
ncbi:MAG: DegT/DnrJ/EryC1/StrS family aminotransferase [Candidatus Omnitrophota bacterium]